MQLRVGHAGPENAVETIETEWILMADGRRLAARLFLPAGARRNPVPLILEYIPYRRRDGTRTGDNEMHMWFAANGYACARLDIAGMGDSDGLVEDEYVRREQDDVLEAIEFLCGQEWCTGVAGMIGISWGGFSGLQAAARRPPRLKAIVTICSTDDRYAIDAHYHGGCLINDNFAWGGAFFNYAALPPDPAVVGHERWRDMWRGRLENHSMFPATWLKHQRRDDFWKHGSVCEDFDAIECPVLAVCGWLDGYTPTVFNLVSNLKATCKGIVGPWGHKEPQAGVPGPAIGFLQECKRWWDKWLKGIDTGVENDPAMRLWLMDYAPPRPHFLERPGRWYGFRAWPEPDAIMSRCWHFTPSGLADKPARSRGARRSVCSPQTTGLRAQEWCPYGQGRIAAEGAMDQRGDDAGSICFDSRPLTSDLRLMGAAKVRLRIAADKPQALVAVRLCDVSPDNVSAFVALGVLNLSHRDSHEHPEPLEPGRFYDVDIELKPVGQIFPAGHRLRIALSSSYWPMVWPSPQRATLTVDPSGCSLDMPVLQARYIGETVQFEPPVAADRGPITVIEPNSESRHICLDVERELTVFRIASDDGRYVLEDIGTELASTRHKTYTIARNDPASCRTTVKCRQEYRRADWSATVETEIDVHCDAEFFYMRGTVETWDESEPFLARTFDEKIPRDCI